MLSTEASARKLRSFSPNNAQPSAGEVPTTSTSLSNKGKSRQESKLSEEWALKNGPHSKKSLDTLVDTAKSSEPSTSDSSNVLNNGAIRVNLEDTQDDSDSDSDSNHLTPEEVKEVEEVCDLWHRNPKAPAASLRDKLRRIITRQKPQH